MLFETWPVYQIEPAVALNQEQRRHGSACAPGRASGAVNAFVTADPKPRLRAQGAPGAKRLLRYSMPAVGQHGIT